MPEKYKKISSPCDGCAKVRRCLNAGVSKKGERADMSSCLIQDSSDRRPFFYFISGDAKYCNHPEGNRDRFGYMQILSMTSSGAFGIFTELNGLAYHVDIVYGWSKTFTACRPEEKTNNTEDKIMASKEEREDEILSIQIRVAEENLERAERLNTPSSVYKPRLSCDGNQWCALYGENLQDGVAGFGSSPDEAYRDFDKNWTEILSAVKKREPSGIIEERIAERAKVKTTNNLEDQMYKQDWPYKQNWQEAETDLQVALGEVEKLQKKLEEKIKCRK